jgi:hypothetical protein
MWTSLKRFSRRPHRIIYERLTEPIHLNLLSLFVFMFGSIRAKIDFDLVMRQQYAFAVMRSAEKALASGHTRVTLIECGVAMGDGLLNLCSIATRVTKATGILFDVIGFDTGSAMPPPTDYRDHPELYREGDFPMDFDKLRTALPSFARLIIGNIDQTAPAFLTTVTSDSPIAFVAIDVDYYSSTKSALTLLADKNPSKYLPLALVYLDDIALEGHNRWSGELLAVEEFNRAEPFRKIDSFRFLRADRLFKNAKWIDQMFLLHVLDHPVVTKARSSERAQVLPNLYLAADAAQKRK